MIQPLVTLKNEHVVLRPMAESDLDAFARIAYDAGIWKYFVADAGTEEGLRVFVDAALKEHGGGTRVPFTIVDAASGAVVGSTSYGSISERDRRVEIGWSWLGREAQGKALNTNAKYLLLAHAFEVLEYERVEFKTDVLNLRARAALKKIGAAEEGVLRSHTLMPGGRRRDTIYYSVLRPEWPEVQARLRALGAAPVQPDAGSATSAAA
ncbi:MAG TPA: GNAT family protein [Longimicrobium sp.]|jgi:RimJ/RimL family protein N-acetyltransferase|uniref:GNAT family N-acetyltransferase n=1 Tax=Longimicrobium sp. TaxID=2029185 RepID=UPI002ED796FD